MESDRLMTNNKPGWYELFSHSSHPLYMLPVQVTDVDARFATALHPTESSYLRIPIQSFETQWQRVAK
jgi:hypothetical protein